MVLAVMIYSPSCCICRRKLFTFSEVTKGVEVILWFADDMVTHGDRTGAAMVLIYTQQKYNITSAG